VRPRLRSSLCPGLDDTLRAGFGIRRQGSPRLACGAVGIDVDLGFTPATNLIALRRLSLDAGASALAPAAWFPFPELRMDRMEQTYRRLDAGRYDYTGINYREILSVSPVGFVTEYPNLWTAVALR
jgi:hypothetical protein